MKRIYSAIAMIILIPLAFTIAQYFISLGMQPDMLAVSSEGDYFKTSYIEENKYYILSGDLLWYDKILSPSEISENSDGNMVGSIDEVEKLLKDENGEYELTSVFRLKLPTQTTYALWFPAEFCENRVYVNGEMIYESENFGGNTHKYPVSFCVELPPNEDGYYEVITNVSSPENYVNKDTRTILIGTTEKITRAYTNLHVTSLVFALCMLFNIAFLLIQIIALKVDQRLLSFLILSFFTFILICLGDGRNIIYFIPNMSYQFGSFLSCISIPLFLASLLYYTYAMYPEFINKKLCYIFGGLLIIPFIDGLCLGRFPALTIASNAVTIIPFAICLYVFVMGYEKSKKYILFYGIGVLSIETGILTTFATQNMAISARYQFVPGYLIMTITMTAVIAAEYSTQTREEEFYTEELSRQLEAMQASENAFLNAQMKPHFLYNTLNTIADCCVTDSEKAKKLISSLEDYLKLILSLDNMDETVPLRRELELAEAYTAIEKERFPSINFYTDFPVRMPSIMMPPITIQPLIENAIKHGVRKSDKPGVVTLRIVEEPDCVEFFVSDNGVGMDQEAIKNLFRVPKENQSIGIYNIDKRLKNIYKKGLKVESTPGLGTCVSFKIMKYI